MSPLVGVLAIAAGVMTLAVLVGAVGGAIHGRLKGELSIGAILVMGTFYFVVKALESWSPWSLVLSGMLPLILTFLVGSVTTQLLETRLGLRPVFATLAGLGSALLAGFLYLMGIKLGWWPLADRNNIALAVLTCLIILSIWKRMIPRNSD